MIDEESLAAIKFGPFNLVMRLKKEVEESLRTYYNLLDKYKIAFMVLLVELALVVFMLFMIGSLSSGIVFNLFLIGFCALFATVIMVLIKAGCYYFELKRNIRENEELLKIIYLRELKEKKNESNFVKNDEKAV